MVFRNPNILYDLRRNTLLLRLSSFKPKTNNKQNSNRRNRHISYKIPISRFIRLAKKVVNKRQELQIKYYLKFKKACFF